MTAPTRSQAAPVPAARPAEAARQWLPHQHGAWAMLAVPFLLGVAASTPGPWQLVLAIASVLGYLASATGQAWLRARRRDPFTVPLTLYGVAFGVLGLALVVVFPALLLTLAVLGPTGALIVAGAKPGTRRDLVNSLAQALQALVLVPSAAWVSGAFEPRVVAIATAVGAAYLLGTVLVVRSVLRERNSTAFTALSVGFHAVLVLPALVLGPAWAAVAVWLTARAAALPTIARRRAGTPRPLKPAQVGAVEAVGSVAVVLVAFLALR
jgi:hypothetical protein